MLCIEGLTKPPLGDLIPGAVSKLPVSAGVIGIVGQPAGGRTAFLRALDVREDPVLTQDRDIEHDLHAHATIQPWAALDPDQDVISTVLYGNGRAQSVLAKLFKLHALERVDQALSILDDLGIGVLALHRVGQLSAGQRQQVAIGAALMGAPDVLIADEPDAGLDPLNARAVMQCLRHTQERLGVTIILGLESLVTAGRYCDHVIVFSEGRVVFEGHAAQVARSGAHVSQGNQMSNAGNSHVTALAPV